MDTLAILAAVVGTSICAIPELRADNLAASDIRVADANGNKDANQNRVKLDDAYRRAECDRKKRAAICKNAQSTAELKRLGCGSLMKEGLSLAARYKEATGSIPPKVMCSDTEDTQKIPEPKSI